MIRIRQYKSADADYLMRWGGEERPFVMWCARTFTYPLTLEQIDKYQREYESLENTQIFTALNEQGIPVGHFCLRSIDYEAGSAHLGRIILDPERRGQGDGKQIVRLAVKYAFELLGVKRVTLGVFDNNPAAVRCYESAGFVIERHVSDYLLFGDEHWGLYEMAVEQKVL